MTKKLKLVHNMTCLKPLGSVWLEGCINEKIENVQPFPNKFLVERIEKLKKRNFDLNKFITIQLT